MAALHIGERGNRDARLAQNGMGYLRNDAAVFGAAVDQPFVQHTLAVFEAGMRAALDEIDHLLPALRLPHDEVGVFADGFLPLPIVPRNAELVQQREDGREPFIGVFAGFAEP